MPADVFLREIAMGYACGLVLDAVGFVGVYFLVDCVTAGGTQFVGGTWTPAGVAVAVLGYLVGSVLGVVSASGAHDLPGSTVLGAVPSVVAPVVWLRPTPRSRRELNPVIVLKGAPLALLPVLVALCYNVPVIAG